MRDWYHQRKTDAVLRVCGMASCAIGFFAIRSLVALRSADNQLPNGPLPLVLAAAGFACASLGAALLVLGHHIFDKVEVSARWHAPPSPTKRPQKVGDIIAQGDEPPADFIAREQAGSSAFDSQSFTPAFARPDRTLIGLSSGQGPHDRS